jgi:ABC-type cobalamin/Fe3+-siderophores transport system ATPase subunit
MKKGKIVREGPPSEVLHSDELSKIFAPDGSQIDCGDPLHTGCVHF